ncbi:MAG: hypothetical protein JXB23_01450, partial [Candidatus Aminicenantes bacterium]|nr:hypothetical protein [Candidatus Aminicenantes bacterium]
MNKFSFCGKYLFGLILLASVIFLSHIPAAQSEVSITVVYPNGGETLQLGSVSMVRWTSDNISGNVIVKLIKGTQVLRSRSVANTGNLSWTVANVVPGSDYKVRIENEDGSVFDESDGHFSIEAVETRSLTMVYPNGGETWEIGNTYTVRWESTGIEVNVILKLMKGPQTVQTINTPNTGSRDWICANVLVGSDYKFVIETTDRAVSDQSDNNFSIEIPPPGRIEITSPNGGERLELGYIKGITWKFEDVAASKVHLVLFRRERMIGRIAKDIPLGLNGRGLYRWSIGKYIGGTAPVGDGYRIKIVTTDNVYQDISDRNFTIVAPPEEGSPVPPRITWFGINNAAETTLSNRLSLNHVAKYSPREYRVQYRRESGLVWTGWMPYTAAPVFQSSVACGEILLYLQLRNEYGESNILSDKIRYVQYTLRTLTAKEAWINHAKPNGWQIKNTRSDPGSDCRYQIFPDATDIK